MDESQPSPPWQSQILTKLNFWASRCKAAAPSTLKGYVSVKWLAMIYHYNLVMLYRPTRTNVVGMAGDWSVQACCKALLLYRKFQMGREIAQPWLGVYTPSSYRIMIPKAYTSISAGHTIPDRNHTTLLLLGNTNKRSHRFLSLFRCT